MQSVPIITGVVSSNPRFRRGVLDTTLCDEVGTAVSSTNKTDRHDITEILLKVALNTITLTPTTRYDRVLSCIKCVL